MASRGARGGGYHHGAGRGGAGGYGSGSRGGYRGGGGAHRGGGYGGYARETFGCCITLGIPSSAPPVRAPDGLSAADDSEAFAIYLALNHARLEFEHRGHEARIREMFAKARRSEAVLDVTVVRADEAAATEGGPRVYLVSTKRWNVTKWVRDEAAHVVSSGSSDDGACVLALRLAVCTQRLIVTSWALHSKSWGWRAEVQRISFLGGVVAVYLSCLNRRGLISDQRLPLRLFFRSWAWKVCCVATTPRLLRARCMLTPDLSWIRQRHANTAPRICFCTRVWRARHLGVRRFCCSKRQRGFPR